MRTASQLIEEIGGDQAVAAAVRAGYGAVRTAKHRNRIPRAWWPELQLAFPKQATLEVLLETERAADADAPPAETHA